MHGVVALWEDVDTLEAAFDTLYVPKALLRYPLTRGDVRRYFKMCGGTMARSEKKKTTCWSGKGGGALKAPVTSNAKCG